MGDFLIVTSDSSKAGHTLDNTTRTVAASNDTVVNPMVATPHSVATTPCWFYEFGLECIVYDSPSHGPQHSQRGGSVLGYGKRKHIRVWPDRIVASKSIYFELVQWPG